MDATEELRPAVMGRYRLGRRIGSGGFGAVYEAHDERLDRAVAVKVIPAHGPAPERGRREALAAARLHHPGIVAVYDAGDGPDGRYLVSELVRGRTLDELERDGALSDRDVLRVGLALAEALAHAHQRGVIHRDVKPQNVIVPDEARDARSAAKLTDFGIAHLTYDEPLTRTGDVVGTLAYMAPEQAAGERVDERADLYSLALVLYEALAGVNPVRAATPAATARLVGTPVPALRSRRRDLPAELGDALDRALAVDPEGRGELDDLADALADALPEVGDEGGTIAPHPLERRRSLPRLGRVAAGLAAGALTAVALTVAGDPPSWADGARGADPPGGAEALVSPLTGALVAAVLVALFPRAGWLVAAAAAIAALADPWPSAAALVALAVVVPPLLLRRRGLTWSLPAVAPALGLIHLAGAYAAIAGRAPGALTRAVLGAAGVWWLLLAEPLVGRELLLGTPPGEAGETLRELVSSGALLLAPVWAVAALVLPWLVAGRSLAADVVLASAWAAALATATGAVAERAGLPEPRGLAAGAVLAGVLAVVGARRANTLDAEHEAA
ncbi:MAG TPA: serine/threonine-protein kinase [Solirubrobacteraceae bacterium]|nr:serine/threonine-protein kinase [Solirubrobacteraceae bacterium]